MGPYDRAIVAAVEAELAGVYNEAAKLRDNPYVLAASTAGSSALAVTLGFIGLAGTTATLPIIIASMGTAAGFAGISVALAQLLAATLDSKIVVDEEMNKALGLASSPFQLGGAVLGTLIDGESGFKRGIEIGEVFDVGYSLGSGLRDVRKGDKKGWIDISQGLVGLFNIEPTKILRNTDNEKQQTKSSDTKAETDKKEQLDRREKEAEEQTRREAALREEERTRVQKAIAAATEQMKAREEADRSLKERQQQEQERRLREERRFLEQMDRRRAEELAEKRERERSAKEEAERAAAEKRRKEEQEAAKMRAAQAEAERWAAQVAADSAQAQRHDRQLSGAGYGTWSNYSDYGTAGKTPNDNRSPPSSPSLRLP